MKIAPRSISRIIKVDLKIRAYRRKTGQLLIAVLCLKRTTRANKLFQRHVDGWPSENSFYWWEMFTVEGKLNRQNDRVYAHTSQEATEIISKVKRGHPPAYVMVWWLVSYGELTLTELHFCEQVVKTRAITYWSDILEKVVKTLNNTVCAGRNLI
jgi:hypothetical protein